MGKLFTSTSLILLGFYLKHTPPLPHFSQVFVFISMYYVGLLCFSVLEKWLYVENVLWGPAHTSLCSSELYALEVLFMWVVLALLLWWDQLLWVHW